jgi:hypothetical protein
MRNIGVYKVCIRRYNTKEAVYGLGEATRMRNCEKKMRHCFLTASEARESTENAGTNG